MGRIPQYFYNIGVWLSQTVSVFLGGHPDESVSERTARAYLAHRGRGSWKVYWFWLQMRAIDSLFILVGEKNHSLNSLEGEVKAKEIWDWTR